MDSKRSTKAPEIMLDQRRTSERIKPEPKRLANFMVDLRKINATRPEDKINAILRISYSNNEPSLRPQHESPVEEVYIAATLHTLRQDSFLAFSIAGLNYLLQP